MESENPISGQSPEESTTKLPPQVGQIPEPLEDAPPRPSDGYVEVEVEDDPTAGRKPGDFLGRPVKGTMTHTRDGKPRAMPPEMYIRKSRVTKLKVEHITRYLDSLSVTGRKYDSCAAAGISYSWLKVLREDPDFVELEEEAMDAYKDLIYKEAHRRAVEGVDEPLVGGQFRDSIIGTVKRYSDRLLELVLKRHIPEFREKWEGTVNVSGGVLVAPLKPKSEEEWLRAFGGKQLPGPGDERIVEQPGSTG